MTVMVMGLLDWKLLPTILVILILCELSLLLTIHLILPRLAAARVESQVINHLITWARAYTPVSDDRPEVCDG